MRVLLTGATGYVGHQLALELANQGHYVNALVRNINSELIPKHKNIQIYEGDICDSKSINRAIKSCEIVFHAAAYTNLKCNKFDSFYEINVTGTNNLLEAASNHKIKRFIHTSTLSVYGPSFKNVSITEAQPRLTSYINDYELTKSMAEELVLAYSKKKLFCIMLNVSRVYGPGLNTYSNGLNKLVRSFKNNAYMLVPSSLGAIANYVFIQDVVKAHLMAMKHGESGENYIVGGHNLTYNSLFAIIRRLTKSRVKLVKVPYGLLKFTATMLTALHRMLGLEFSLTPKILDSLFTNRQSSSAKAIKSLNYSITPIKMGMQKTIRHLNLE